MFLFPFLGHSNLQTPEHLATAYFYAFVNGNCDSLFQVTHPDTIERMRNSNLLNFHYDYNNLEDNRESLSQEEVVRLFCKVHQKMFPTPPHAKWVLEISNSAENKDYYIVNVVFGWSRVSDPSERHVSNQLLVLKRSIASWKVYWIPKFGSHFGVEYNIKKDISE